MKDMVDVFNQITKPKHEEDNRVQTVITHHFEKFRYFYDILHCTLQEVSYLDCKLNDDGASLEMSISFKKPKQLAKFKKKLTEKIQSSDSTFFIASLSENGESLNMTIDSKSIKRECEIYGIGSDTH